MFSDQRQQEETPKLRNLSTCHQASFAHAEDLRLCRTEYSNYTYLHLKGNGSLTSRRLRNVSLRACLLDCCNLAWLTFRGVCDEVILFFVDPGRFRFQRQSWFLSAFAWKYLSPWLVVYDYAKQLRGTADKHVRTEFGAITCKCSRTQHNCVIRPERKFSHRKWHI